MLRDSLRLTKYTLAMGMAAAILAGGLRSAPAHTLFINPRPRDQMDGYKPIRTPGFVLPCGVARKDGQPTTTLQSGAMQMVQWKETVPHDGCFLIEFSKSDTDPFMQLAVEKHPSDSVPNRSYTKMIQLPNMECTGCILRVRQYMAPSNPCPPANLQDMDGNLYYSCANITLKKSASGTNLSTT